MSEKLVMSIRNQDTQETLLAVYFYWGAFDNYGTVHIAGRIMKALRDCTVDTPVAEMAKKLCAEFPKMGLVTHKSWFTQSKDPYVDAMRTENFMEDDGIPEGTDKIAGLIALLPSSIKAMEEAADDLEWVDLGWGQYMENYISNWEHLEDYEGEDEEDIPKIKPFPPVMGKEFDWDQGEDWLKAMEEIPSGYYEFMDEGMFFKWQ